MILFIIYTIIGSLVFISTIVMTLWFNSNRILNSYLILISIVLCAYLVLYGVHNIYNNILDIPYINYYQVVLTLLPAVYLFFQKLFFNLKYPEKKDMFFFLVPVLCFNTVGGNFNLRFNLILHFVLFILYVVFYFFLIIRLLSNHLWNIEKRRRYSLVVVDWAIFIFKMLIIVLLHFLIFVSIQLVSSKNKFNFFLDFSFLIVFVIGYFKVILTPELLYGNNHKNDNLHELENKIVLPDVWSYDSIKKSKAKKDIFLKEKVVLNLNEHINAIEKVAIINYAFRNNNFSLNELSLESGIPKYYLEYIFKHHCKLNFDAYKRLVRVFDAMNLINQGYLKNNTLNTLSEFVGFSSYNPFFLSFKQVLGVSPYEFNKNRKIKKTIVE